MEKEMEDAQKRIEKKEKESMSMIVYEIYPEGNDVDLDDVCKSVKSIEMEGLSWGEGVKKVPFVWGIFILKMICTIVDSKVNTDLLEEKITGIGGVKNVKIGDWQKK